MAAPRITDSRPVRVCPLCNGDQYLDPAGDIGCHICDTSGTVPAADYDQAVADAEQHRNRSRAFDTYIKARETWEGLKDDIDHGSAEECRAAHQHIRQARINYDTATVQARQYGVLDAARRMFR